MVPNGVYGRQENLDSTKIILYFLDSYRRSQAFSPKLEDAQDKNILKLTKLSETKALPVSIIEAKRRNSLDPDSKYWPEYDCLD